jgi:hypothetical protein
MGPSIKISTLSVTQIAAGLAIIFILGFRSLQDQWPRYLFPPRHKFLFLISASKYFNCAKYLMHLLVAPYLLT